MNGNKRYEFRKSIFRCREDVELVYIYSTSPVKKIVGVFTIETIIEDHPRNLWEKFKEFSGIGEEEFFSYFGGHKKGFAIGIGNVEVFEDPIDPKNFISGFVPPQSFRYVEKHWGLRK
jgi:predicted transcriptional regulator